MEDWFITDMILISFFPIFPKPFRFKYVWLPKQTYGWIGSVSSRIPTSNAISHLWWIPEISLDNLAIISHPIGHFVVWCLDWFGSQSGSRTYNGTSHRRKLLIPPKKHCQIDVYSSHLWVGRGYIWGHWTILAGAMKLEKKAIIKKCDWLTDRQTHKQMDKASFYWCLNDFDSSENLRKIDYLGVIVLKWSMYIADDSGTFSNWLSGYDCLCGLGSVWKII